VVRLKPLAEQTYRTLAGEAGVLLDAVLRQRLGHSGMAARPLPKRRGQRQKGEEWATSSYPPEGLRMPRPWRTRKKSDSVNIDNLPADIIAGLKQELRLGGLPFSRTDVLPFHEGKRPV
jgi:hypothetical protein